ncbi:MAG: hypothetical protein C3F13_19570 [Anaerolineales bacterium]|nr:DUF1269 domain-containing protein [Anaerolineae bacterium]PWB49595.1 MAG: hypothetical protein C3F13_19570 [Anaerolineales bacterium]
MSSFLVFVFTNESGADQVVGEIQSLQEQKSITIIDAATVIRKTNDRLKINQVSCLACAGALGGPFWGALIGQLLYLPWLGVDVNIVTHALQGKFTGFGISSSFAKEVGAAIMPGYSALFLIVADLIEGKLINILSRHKATLLRRNLSDTDECALRETFAASDQEL